MTPDAALNAAPPQRLRLSRVRGSRLPPHAVSVAYPTPWANPYRPATRGPEANAVAVEQFVDYLKIRPDLVVSGRERLSGVSLACWCDPVLVCHADVWLLLVGPLTRFQVLPALDALRVSASGVSLS